MSTAAPAKSPELEQRLTKTVEPAKLPDEEQSFQPVGMDMSLYMGRMLKFTAEARRHLKGLLFAVEEFQGIDPRSCPHCGRPIK